MSQDNRFDPSRLERIERRLQVLEDAEAIRNLKARYAALCNARRQIAAQKRQGMHRLTRPST